MNYKKYKCPVCKEVFCEDDDVVVCPECGTPHHRGCWFENGKCANEALHGNQEEINEIIENEGYVEEVEAPSEEKAPAQEKSGNPFIDINPAQTALIEGKPGVYYEIAVKKNQSYYIPRFIALSKTNAKAILWNFMAFLTPFSWAIYRKMYKLSALLLALYTLVIGISGFYMFKNTNMMQIIQNCATEDPNFAQDISEYYKNPETFELTDNQKEYVEAFEKYSPPAAVSVLSLLVFKGSRFFMGFMATKLYMKKIRGSIEKGEKKGLSGDGLKLYILRKNGTLPLIVALFFAFFEIVTIYL